MRLGLIVNPVAGVGGRVGLKGSDGADIVRRALELGAVRESPHRAQLALHRLAALREHLEIVTYSGEMGAEEALACGLHATVAGSPASAAQTSAADTETAARALRDAGVDLLLFAGGDGTARDVFNAVGDSVAVLGIPAGVKIHSAVFANTPAAAGDLAALYLQGRREAMRLREAEVMDIDEEAFRAGHVSARLYGYLRVPYQRTLVQSAKAGGVAGDAAELAGIARDVVNHMAPATLYLLGPGTTTRAISEALSLPKTLLGVDAVRDRELAGADLSEAQILALLDCYGEGSQGGPAPGARIVVTVIGGQGHMFGRGNQQFSPRVIRRVGLDHVIVVATQTKLLSLGGGPLLVDTGDPALDTELGGYTKVVTGLGERMMYRVSALD
jgi:predicted polyphosphate/ATP-dependent NAD kinase